MRNTKIAGQLSTMAEVYIPHIQNSDLTFS